MKRKNKFPCGSHYIPKGIGPDGKAIYWTSEECEKMYVPTCPECRWSYKWPGNDSLFNLPWWRYNYKLNWWIFANGHYNLRTHAIWTLKHKGLWRALKCIFWERSHYDQYQSLAMPFLEAHWAPLEFKDIKEGWVDLSVYYEDKPYKIKNREWETEAWLKAQKERDIDTAHYIKVARRYQRMWEVELKLRTLFCKYDGKGDAKCEYGTYSCVVPHSVDFLNSMKGNKIMFKEWWSQQ